VVAAQTAGSHTFSLSDGFLTYKNKKYSLKAFKISVE